MPDDSTHYLYGLYMRPPGLGCQPRDGLDVVERLQKKLKKAKKGSNENRPD